MRQRLVTHALWVGLFVVTAFAAAIAWRLL
jgi:hypothetical protein